MVTPEYLDDPTRENTCTVAPCIKFKALFNATLLHEHGITYFAEANVRTGLTVYRASSLKAAWRRVRLPFSKSQVIAKASTSVTTLKRSKDISRILSRHHPKPTFALYFYHIRSSDQVAIAKPPVLVFALVAKNHTDASASLDGNSAKVSGHRFIEALGLSFYNLPDERSQTSAD